MPFSSLWHALFSSVVHQATVQALTWLVCIYFPPPIHPLHCWHRFLHKSAPGGPLLKICKWFLFRIKFLPLLFPPQNPSLPYMNSLLHGVPRSWCSILPSVTARTDLLKTPILPSLVWLANSFSYKVWLISNVSWRFCLHLCELGAPPLCFLKVWSVALT